MDAARDRYHLGAESESTVNNSNNTASTSRPSEI